MAKPCVQRLRSEWSFVAMAVGFVVLMCVAQQMSDRHGGWVFMRSAYAEGAWWQLWTSQWVHFGVRHAALNAASMVLMLWVMRGWVAGAIQCAALTGGYIGVATVLALDPACAHYAGASGALHGFWAGNAVALVLGPYQALRHRSALRWLGGCMLGAMAVKFWWMLRVGAGGYSLQGLGLAYGPLGTPNFPVYSPAHFAGVAGGVAVVLLYLLFNRLVRHRPAQGPAGEKQ